MKLKIGDPVTWTSSANGTLRVKSGTIVALVPAGESADQHLPEGRKMSCRKFDYDMSKVDRYLVSVPVGRSTHWYAPLASIVDNQNAD